MAADSKTTRQQKLAKLEELRARYGYYAQQRQIAYESVKRWQAKMSEVDAWIYSLEQELQHARA